MRAKRARHSNGWPTSRVDEAGFGDGTQVMQPMLQQLMKPHTVGACHHVSLWGSRVTSHTIVKPCGSRLDPVPSAAPKARRLWHHVWDLSSRSSVGTESFREYDRIVTGIGAEHADATSALSDAFPVSEGARPYLCRGRFQRAQKCSWTVHAFPAEPCAAADR